MGSLRQHVFLLMFLMVSAEEEPFVGQREVVFDLSDVLDEDFFEQKEVIPDFLRETDVPQSGPPKFSPRSAGPPQIPFPLARPKSNNVQAICLYGSQRPRYPKETLPRNGFGYLVRQANAVNQLESWFSKCCSNGNEDEEVTLCCAEQAWKKSLSAFCDEEFSVKTSHFHCCKKKGSAKWDCFENAAADQSYEPSGHVPWADIPSMTEDFTFNPRTCPPKRLRIGPRALKGRVTGLLNSLFPYGRPNSGNIGSICTNNKQRRQILSRCLPRKGHGLLSHQAVAMNDLEKSFNQCCKKKEKQACAERKWKMMMDEFCTNEKTGDLAQFVCCEKEKGEKQYDCFASAAPNPEYTLYNDSMSVPQARPTLDTFCDMYLSYHSVQRMLDESLEKFAGKLYKQCCLPMEEKNPACLQTELNSIVDEVCSDQFWGFLSCCKVKHKSRSKCVTKHILRKLAEANGLNYYSKKKCPMFS